MNLFSRNKEPEALDQYILGYAQSAGARQYITTHLGRLLQTLSLTPRGTKNDRILEMGAYMQITPALKSRFGYGEVRGCYLGQLGKTEKKKVRSATGEKFQCYIDLFNAETDRYPYPDGHFATVLCCELFEHLAEDPMHLIAEVNRILAPGGTLVMSTPNITALRGVAAVLTGYHPGLYSEFIRPRDGEVDPRHAREYAPREMRQVLEAGGFSVERLETGPVGLEPSNKFEWAEEVLKAHDFPTDLRGDVIHVMGRKTGPVAERYPAWLYV